MHLIVLFAFCSCAKDYPQQVKDRVEQYQKEGKKVLSHLCRKRIWGMMVI